MQLECQRVTQDFDQAIQEINLEFKELAVQENLRIQHQDFVDQFNAGKPIGFFQLPSMLTRVDKPRIRIGKRSKSMIDTPSGGLGALISSFGEQATKLQK